MISSSSTAKSSSSAGPKELPPTITPESLLLGSAIPLPNSIRIFYRQFIPSGDDLSLRVQEVDSARRKMLEDSSTSISLIDTLLPRAYIDRADTRLFVFVICDGELSPGYSTLMRIRFSGLSASNVSSFSPQELYPCSPVCSTLRQPCIKCLQSANSPNKSQTEALPRVHLREIYSILLDSIRDKLIDHIVGHSAKLVGRTPLTRMNNGFLLRPSQFSLQWSTDWEHHAMSRTLVFCQLHLYMDNSRIVIHPIPRITPFIPLSLPLPQGTPLVLLPYATPAYYLASYSGPTTSLTEQFEASLKGLGAGAWRDTGPNKDHSPDPTYVILWVAVQNTQGEEKGITVIWPQNLCLALQSSSRDHIIRKPLVYIPDLHPQLQPSPPQPSAPPPFSNAGTPAASYDYPAILPQMPSILRRPPLRRSATSSPSRAFQALTISRAKPVRRLAANISTYVDDVVRDREKERERERERARREREAASPKLPRAVPRASLQPPLVQLQEESNFSTGALSQPHSSEPSPSSREPEPPNQQEVAASVVAEPPPASLTPVSVPEPSVSEDSSLAPMDQEAVLPSSWDSSSTAFMGMGMDYEMGFDAPATGGLPSIGNGTFNFDDSFGDFTEDDFSFFDDPVAASRPSTVAPLQLTPHASLPLVPGLLPSALDSLNFPHATFNITSSHLDPLPLSIPTVVVQPSSWPLSSGFTPLSLIPDVVASEPALPSPRETSFAVSYPSPATPVVKLAYDERHGSVQSHHQLFEPIPFAESHRISDGKYAKGKFALPTPPDNEDRTYLVDFPPSPGARQTDHTWRADYCAITDPRMGVVRKLIGVKRRADDGRVRDPFVVGSPKRKMEHEEWALPTPSTDEGDDERTDNESDEEDPVMDDTDPQRSTTPRPNYIPPGPSLLCTQFYHPILLAQSRPLRSESSILAAPAVTPGVHSVPTPVSPAAIASAISEKARSLEAAVQILAKELVENCLWAQEWMLVVSPFPDTSDILSQKDIMTAHSALNAPISDLERAATMKNLLGPSSDFGQDLSPSETFQLKRLDSPSIIVGKAESTITLLPTALRFWEKLGLAPRAGKKDVQAYVCFEEGEERIEAALAWLRDVSAVYTANNYGSHMPGIRDGLQRPGTIPIQFESFRKDLSFLQHLGTPHKAIVIYVVIPASAVSLDSPVLRQVLSTIKRADKLQDQVLFHLVPERLVIGSTEDRVLERSHTTILTRNVYDRLLQQFPAPTTRRLHGMAPMPPLKLPAPAFALARTPHLRTNFIREIPLHSHDVVDRGTLLHVGYSTSHCGRWHIAACVDERGEAHDIGVWLAQAEGPESGLIPQVWTFMTKFASRANIEWRIIISKLGTMGEGELLAWKSYIESSRDAGRGNFAKSISIFVTERDSSWTFLTSHPTSTPSPPSSSNGRHSFKDVSRQLLTHTRASAYALFSRSAQPLHSVSPHLGSSQSYIPEHQETAHEDSLGLRPLSTMTLIYAAGNRENIGASMLHLHLLFTTTPSIAREIHEDATRNYHELAVLAQERLVQETPSNLPLHLSILNLVSSALSFIRDLT